MEQLFDVTLFGGSLITVQMQEKLVVNGSFVLNTNSTLSLNGFNVSFNGPCTFNGVFKGHPNSHLNITNAGTISGDLLFSGSFQNLAILELSRPFVNLKLGGTLTLHQNGSKIYQDASLTIQSSAKLIIGAGSIAGLTIDGTLQVNGDLQLDAGGFINNGNPPYYQVNSSLIYNTGGVFNRNLEWGSATFGTKGYPWNVYIQNNTQLVFSNTTTFDVGCGGSLYLGNPSTTSNGSLVLSDMGIHDLYVNGDLLIGSDFSAGTLTMSNTIGGDLYLNGNWTRKASGTVNFGAGNGRAVFFIGGLSATLSAANGQDFPYVYLQKSISTIPLILFDNIRVIHEIGFVTGTLDLSSYNKNVLLISDAQRTARVGISDSANTRFLYGASNDSGQFVMQRYMPAKRAWRLLAAPIFPNGGVHTISQAWQERAIGLGYQNLAAATASHAVDTISAGYGTLITGGTSANGFDQSQTNSSSIKYYQSGTWFSPANINNTDVTSKEGWMVFVRGDRKNYGAITNQYKNPEITTLRPRGRVFIGTKTVTSSGMTVVGNPYASAIDYQAMLRQGSGLSGTATYYMWDPNLGGAFGAGGFVALTWNGINFTRSVTSSTIDNRYIPSGAAILVDFGLGGTLQMSESNKVTENTSFAFRPMRQLSTELLAINADSTTDVLDGNIVLVDQDNDNQLEKTDAKKPNNFAENFSVFVQHQPLAIERRKPFVAGDTLFYNMNQLKARKYRLQIDLRSLELSTEVDAFLEDLFFETQLPLSLTEKNEYSFEATNAAAGSYRSDRFRIVFTRAVRFVKFEAMLQSNKVSLNWQLNDFQPQVVYHIQRSNDGSQFTNLGSIVNQQIWQDQTAISGVYYYRIIAKMTNGKQLYSEIIQVNVIEPSSEILVQPNPILHQQLHLKLQAIEAGHYQVNILTNSGQLVHTTNFIYLPNTSGVTINLNTFKLAAGLYHGEILHTNGKKYTIKFVVE